VAARLRVPPPPCKELAQWLQRRRAPPCRLAGRFAIHLPGARPADRMVRRALAFD
jgi:hypothetical protein